jgi:hypothetical protein
MQKKERHTNHRKREGTNKIYIDKAALWQDIGEGTENIVPIKPEINPNYILISSSYNTQNVLVLQCKSKSLVMFTAIIPASSQTHPKHTNILCEKMQSFYM